MRIPTVPRRHVVLSVVAAGGLAAALLFTQPAPVATPAKPTGSTALALAWVDGGAQLQVSGDGYRPDGIVDIRLGSDAIQETRADRTGEVLVHMPQTLIAAGQPGASVIVVGRSKIGTYRALTASVPPRAEGRGPMVELPWLVAAVVLVRIGVALWRFGWCRRAALWRFGRRQRAALGRFGRSRRAALWPFGRSRRAARVGSVSSAGSAPAPASDHPHRTRPAVRRRARPDSPAPPR